MFICLALLATSIGFAQAYDGFGDHKTSVGATIQSQGIGLVFDFDRGITDYISYGTSLGFIVKADDLPKTYYTQSGVTYENADPESSTLFLEKIDFSVHLNGHYGKLMGMNEMMDFYGGLSLGFRNIGAQVGYRYLVSDNFGFFVNTALPVYKFSVLSADTTRENGIKDYYPFYNQPVFGIGIVFSK